VGVKQALAAYGFCTFVSVPFGLVTSYLAWDVFQVNIPNHITVLSAWLACAGLPSVLWSNQNLARALGARRQVVPELRIVGRRDIPVFADAARLLGRRLTMTVPVADVLEFRYGSTVISEPEMVKFLVSCWRRQQRNEPPLSRLYWVKAHRLDRARYDAHVALLRACNLIMGERGRGTRNRLRWGPQQTMVELKHRSIA
jgi:hypothetical protein